MLNALFGNKNIQRILLFLFVNGKCYGTQLHRLLKTPLTPLQKALNRLENGGIVTSFYEGKTRLYQFNPAYPLVAELELLLKRAYTLLPSQEKKNYYVAKVDPDVPVYHENKIPILLAFWERLHEIKRLCFKAKSQSSENQVWEGKGKGEVTIAKESCNVLIFNEKGFWQNMQGREVGFSNVFRWTLDRYAGVISLEHLRRGADHPVFLFHLAPCGKHSLSSVDSHLCEGDTYFGQALFDLKGLKLQWRVIGSKKNEEIDYYYS